MSAVALAGDYYTIAEYQELLEQSVERLEYKNGKIHAINDNTTNHGKLCTNASFTLNIATKNTNHHFTIFGSQVKIGIKESNSFVFPDAMMICGEIELSEKDQHAITNPSLIVEVLSKSTERYNRGEKFHKYSSLPSFKEYILIEQYKPIVDILYKANEKYWKMTTAIGLEDEFYLHIPDLNLYEGFI